jgi:hypothetical protein
MNKYLIRFNKSRGQPNRGSKNHVWRVFENDKEYIFKNFKINVPSYSESSGDSSDDYNICCHGYLTIDKETSTAIINETATQ